MRPFYDQLPRALEEAAWIDGATMWQGFTRIILPLSGPGLAATAILCFLFAWNDFFFALILTRTEAMTAPVAVVNFMNYEGWEWGRIAAGGTMIMLPVLVFSFIVRRFLGGLEQADDVGLARDIGRQGDGLAALGGDLCHDLPRRRLARAVVEGDLVAARRRPTSGLGTDAAGASGDQQCACHLVSPSPRRRSGRARDSAAPGKRRSAPAA
ncbi:hypothetical protein BH11PSE3_BH11PSE3_30040 [soil metagenome]